MRFLRNLFHRKSFNKPATISSEERWRIRPRVEELEARLVPAEVVADMTAGVTANGMVSALVGAGVSTSNITYTGAQNAAGKFSGFLSAIGIDAGIVLGTGSVGNGTSPPAPAGSAQGVMGPNNIGSFSGGPNGTPSDPDLDAILGATGFDAAVLEFDFVPAGSVLHFQFVFGSEEYPEFVNAGFNDVFGFFLNGTNVALIPGTNTPVSIDNVNATTNSTFYVDNTAGTFFTQMDAFTTVLTVTANVNAGQVNHIKLAIENGGDEVYDSWVLIKAGSFGSPPKANGIVYHPVRYVQTSPNFLAGTFTLVNQGNATLTGPLYIYLLDLPAGVKVLNYTAYHDKLGYKTLSSTLSLAPHQTFYMYFSFYNPLHQPLSTFFNGFPVAISQTIL
jgi:hypothetical protein